MSELIAVQGCVLSFDALNTGTISITSTPSLKNFISNNAVYSGSIVFTVAGVTNTSVGGTAGTGTGTITATATKTLDNNQPVMRLNDSVTILVTGTISGSPGTWNTTITITNAGQVKVTSN